MGPIPGIVRHWLSEDRLESLVRTPPLTTLREVIRCQPEDWAVACIDSALRRSPRVSLDQLKELLPHERRVILGLVDPRAESCIESLARVRLGRLGLRPSLQVPVVRGIRVDMVLSDRLVVELDGSEFHSGPVEFEADRARDAVLNALGYRVLHFSYRQVVHHWETVEGTIRMVLRQAPPR
jgi:very-short-patch-repair endonuclease